MNRECQLLSGLFKFNVNDVIKDIDIGRDYIVMYRTVDVDNCRCWYELHCTISHHVRHISLEAVDKHFEKV